MTLRPLGLAGFTLLERAGDDRSATFRAAVDPSSPFLAGHFPDEAILPGVTHLGLALQVAEGLHAREAPLTGVRDVRLRQGVGPGDVLEVRVTSGPVEGECRFEIRKGDLVASSGVLVFALPGR